MATVTGLTAARMAQVIAAQMSTADIVGDDLIITRNDLTAVNAGNVRGPKGDTGSISGLPHLFDPAAARFRCTTAPTKGDPISNEAVGQIVLDEAEFSPSDSIVLLSNGKVQVTTTGVYHISASVNVARNTSVGSLRSDILLASIQTSSAGGEVIQGNSGQLITVGTAVTADSLISGDVHLPANAIVEVDYIYGYALTVLNSKGLNTLSIHRVA